MINPVRKIVKMIDVASTSAYNGENFHFLSERRIEEMIRVEQDGKRTVLPDMRMKKITMTNFRNIDFGELEFSNCRAEDFEEGRSSVLGIYGQNGSGKTTALAAMKILRPIVGRKGTATELNDSLIQEGKDSCKLEYEFIAYDPETAEQYQIYYSFGLRKPYNPGHIPSVVHESALFMQEMKPQIVNEIIKCRYINGDGTKSSLITLIDTSEENLPFGNKKRFQEFGGFKFEEDLRAWKKKAIDKSDSYIFSKDVFKWLLDHAPDPRYRKVLEMLQVYCQSYLLVYKDDPLSNNYSMIGGSQMSIYFWRNTKKKYGLEIKCFNGLVSDDHIWDEEEKMDLLQDVDRINEVLARILPGFRLHITFFEHGNGTNYELLTERNNHVYSLIYESAGIRRLVSVASLLIAMYSDPSMTIAIDEIDSGIFEFTLGELLRVLNENGRGQLVFTSHNLRPLEVLKPSNLLFTSFRDSKRFIRLPNVSGNNNMRDTCFRNIVLGDGLIYDAPNRYQIQRAFEYAAGRGGRPEVAQEARTFNNFGQFASLFPNIVVIDSDEGEKDNE